MPDPGGPAGQSGRPPPLGSPSGGQPPQNKPLIIGLIAALLLVAGGLGVWGQLLRGDGGGTRTAYCSALRNLAACRGGDGSAETSTPADVAVAAGCKYLPYEPDEMFVKEAGKCTINGNEVRIYTFGKTGARDGWLQAAATFGSRFLVGDDWIISGPRPALEAAQGKAGGAIQ